MKGFALFCFPGWRYVNILIDKSFPAERKTRVEGGIGTYSTCEAGCPQTEADGLH